MEPRTYTTYILAIRTPENGPAPDPLALVAEAERAGWEIIYGPAEWPKWPKEKRVDSPTCEHA